MTNSFKSVTKWSYYLVLLPLVMVFAGWQGWALWNWAISPPQPPSSTGDDTVQIHIPSGATGRQIGYDLEKAGIIRSAEVWRWWTFWQGLQSKEGGYKAGTYRLSQAEPLPAIASKIWNGEVMQLSFTIPEGWTMQQMANYFESLGYFSAEEFIAAASNIPYEQYSWLPQDLPHLEGFLYPDTYKLGSDRVSADQIVAIMLDHFQNTALPLYEEVRSQTSLDLKEWVTLASIVEKEAVVKEEQGRIAGVFTARLDRNMTLGSDPTVEYGLGIKQTADQPLTLAQVKMPSPYNTYINAGLPPTPIAAPGFGSLKATLYPENTDYLYFVARYDGTHVFSKTLAAHEAATRAIRQQRQAQNNGN